MRESIAPWLLPRVEFSLHGARWPILFDHRALLYCEYLTGTDMLSLDLSRLSAKLLRALLFVALDRAGSGLTLEDVGALLTPRELPRIRLLLLAAWQASMPEPKPETKKPRERKRFTWPEAWAAATSPYGLGLSEEAWLEMAPRQMEALQAVRTERFQREEVLVGIIASTVANYSMNRPKQPVTATSFMIHPLNEEALEEYSEPVTGEYIMAQMARARKGHG